MCRKKSAHSFNQISLTDWKNYDGIEVKLKAIVAENQSARLNNSLIAN